MPFLAVGVEHTTAPLDVRERLAFDALEAANGNVALGADALVEEAIILSTCNRTEIYLVTDHLDEAEVFIQAFLTRGETALRPYLRSWRETDAIERIFRVAAGLESQVSGESQIASQVSDALARAQDAGSAGPNLHALFRFAVSCARQARAGTALGRVHASVGSEAVALADTTLHGLAGRTVLLIGGGEVSKLVGAELRQRDVGSLLIANRTDSVAHDLAARYAGRHVPIDSIAQLGAHVDAIFTATSSPHYMIAAGALSEALRGRVKPLHIFDLALPRDVDPDVGELPGVVLHDLDDLLPAQAEASWNADVQAIEAILAAEIHEFIVWYHTRRVAPVIASLRSHVEAVQQQEIKRIAPQIKNLTERERAAVESMGQRLVDKMFHHLVLRLRLAAQTDPSLVDAAEFFFLHGEGGLFEHAAHTHHPVETR